jgi:valyl-tRNA synthetase
MLANCTTAPLHIGLSEAELTALAVTAPMTAAELSQLPLPERHIVSKCHQLVAKVTAGLESYDMGDTGRLIYEFLWDEYADWYIEASKVSVVIVLAILYQQCASR